MESVRVSERGERGHLFWTRLATLLTSSRQLWLPAQEPAHDLDQYPSVGWGGDHEPPCLAEELWIVDGF